MALNHISHKEIELEFTITFLLESEPVDYIVIVESILVAGPGSQSFAIDRSFNHNNKLMLGVTFGFRLALSLWFYCGHCKKLGWSLTFTI